MTIIYLEPDELKVTPSAQRRLSIPWAKELGAKFDINKCTPLMVSPKGSDGKYPVNDGMHRASGAKLSGFPGKLPCIVVEWATDEQKQAEAFLAFNKQKPVSNVDKFKVRVTAKEALACAIQRELESFGLVMGSSISCVTDLEKIARRSTEQLSQTLKIVTAAWHGRPKATTTLPIRTIGRLVNERTFDQRHLIERLKGIEPVALIAKANAGKELLGQSADIAALNQLVKLYNNGKRTGKLEEFTSPSS